MKFDRVRGYNAANRVTGFQIQTRRFTLCVMASLGFGFPHISYGLNVRKGPEMPKIAIKAEKHPTEAEVDSAYAAWEVAYDAIGARALEAVRKAFGADTESFVRYSGYASEAGKPIDNLDEVCHAGKVIFVSEAGNWGDCTFQSEAIENPTWLDATVQAEAMIRTTGDYHHVFLESVAEVAPDGDVPFGITALALVMGS